MSCVVGRVFSLLTLFFCCFCIDGRDEFDRVCVVEVDGWDTHMSSAAECTFNKCVEGCFVNKNVVTLEEYLSSNSLEIVFESSASDNNGDYWRIEVLKKSLLKDLASEKSFDNITVLGCGMDGTSFKKLKDESEGDICREGNSVLVFKDGKYSPLGCFVDENGDYKNVSEDKYKFFYKCNQFTIDIKSSALSSIKAYNDKKRVDGEPGGGSGSSKKKCCC